MKKVCKIVLIFLVILSLYSTIFNVYAKVAGCTCPKFASTYAEGGTYGRYYNGTQYVYGYYKECCKNSNTCSRECPTCLGQKCINGGEYSVGGSSSQGIWDIGGDFLNLGAGGLSGFNSGKVNLSFKSIVDFLWGLGLLAVLASTVILGIKYMLVNPNEKSRVKQATTPYIIGVVIIFGAVTIWKLVIDILEGSMLG